MDLSENMFEYVVVERKNHALSIAIQYEKHPTFYANCKMIGHTLQNCSKLGAPSSSKNQAQKSQHDPNTSKPNVSGKAVFRNQSEKRAHFTADTQKKTVGTIIDLEEGEFSLVLKGKSDRNVDPLNQSKRISAGTPLRVLGQMEIIWDS